MSTPSRSLSLAGATNFRDLGGYLGHGGQMVRWRTLFRSDNLSRLTSQDIATLGEVGVSKALDLRGVAERSADPYLLPGIDSHSLAIEPTVLTGMKALLESGHRLSAQDAVELMLQTYRDFVHDNAPRFAELFGHLLGSREPLVIHCTAGKDRTGFAAALILLALGVDRSVVMEDYLLTNALYRTPRAPSIYVSSDVQDVLVRVQAEFLVSSLHEIDTAYGGVEPYLAQALGVGRLERELLVLQYLQA